MCAMAYSTSPQPGLSSGVPSTSTHNHTSFHPGHPNKHDASGPSARGRSLTPTSPSVSQPQQQPQPQQPLSKRDKRRNLLAEKLNDITAAFSSNRDSHYRQQLQALQVDMNLIMQADPYAEHPLEDMGDDIVGMVAAALGPQANAPGQKKPEVEVSGLAGKWYSRFAEEVNNLMEDRDAALTALENNYTRTLQELHWNNDFKVRLAKEEHRQLASTLRERLIQSISQKKSRLMRDKEQLDLADSSALLLHPNQFSITNPASPGGVAGNRKTRHMRYRPGGGDLDDTGGEGGQKRKRKMGATANDDNDVGSPAPPIARLSGEVAGIASPLRADGRPRGSNGAAAEAPAYSVERLFTEKELSMHFNVAQVATAQYFAALRAQESGAGSSQDGANGRTSEQGGGGGDEASAENIPTEGGPEDEAPAPVTLVDMDRTANQSQSHHATRSTRNGLAGTTSGPSAAASTALDALLGSQPSTITSTTNLPGINPPAAWLPLAANINSKKAEVNTPGPLSREDAEDDLARMEQWKRDGSGIISRSSAATGQADPTARRLLDEMVGPLASSYGGAAAGAAARGGATNVNANAGRLGVPPSSFAASMAAAGGGVPMSAQSSTAGVSDFAGVGAFGGVPMSRFGEGSSMGGGSSMMMKRSASGTGMDSVGKRARNR